MFVSLFSSAQNEKVKIQGTVTDYEGNPIDSANVILLDPSFRKPIAQGISDENGHYKLEVPKGNYYGMAVVNMNHYGKTRLEYWAWNIPAQKDMEINPKYHKLEVYALNAFRPQGAYPSYIVYFRPMSLSKSKENPNGDLAPDLEKSEIDVEINGENVEIYSIQKVKEYNKNRDGEVDYMTGYMLQIALPENFRDDAQHFRVVLKDEETGDKGEATYYLMNNNYVKN
jgi:hypothetical protein